MGLWAAAALTLNCQRLWNKGGWDLSWRWWPWTMLSTNLLEVMLLHWSKKLKSIPSWKTVDEDDEEAEDSDTSALTPTAPFSLVSAVLVVTLPPVDFLPLGWASFPLSKWGLLAKDAPLDPGTGLFCTGKWNSVCSLALPPLLDGKDWDKPMEDSCWIYTRAQLIWPYRQASLGGITSLRLWRKGNHETQTSWCSLEAELNTCTKIWADSQLIWKPHCPEWHKPQEAIHVLLTQV